LAENTSCTGHTETMRVLSGTIKYGVYNQWY